MLLSTCTDERGCTQVGNEFSSVEALWSQFENVMAKEEEGAGTGEGQQQQQQQQQDQDQDRHEETEQGAEDEGSENAENQWRRYPPIKHTTSKYNIRLQAQDIN